MWSLPKARYSVKGAPDSGLTLVQIAKRAYTDKLPEGVTSGLDATEFFRPAELILPLWRPPGSSRSHSCHRRSAGCRILHR
jgi:hypothetical protein